MCIRDRLNTLIASSLPPSISYKVLTASTEQLTDLIPHYTNWHNQLIVKHKKEKQATQQTERSSCGKLVTDLQTLEELKL